jgi:predicted GNAT family N-acyltransferase
MQMRRATLRAREAVMSVTLDGTDVDIELVETTEDKATVFALRMLVFVEEQRVPPEEELDAYDVTATHFLVRVRGPLDTFPPRIVATARLVDKGDGIGKIGRVAVLAEFRGMGLGAALMQYIETYSRKIGYRRLDLEAQCRAIPFYQKLGYVAEGEVFQDANIEHRHMSKRLTRASVLSGAAEDGFVVTDANWGSEKERA